MFMGPNYKVSTISLLNVFMCYGEKPLEEFDD